MPPTLLLPHHLSRAAVTSFTTSEYLSDLKWIPSCCSSFPWPKECAHAAPTLSSSCMWLQSFALLQQDTHPHPRSHPSIQSALVFVQYRKVKRRLHLKKSHIKNRTNERTATHRPNFEKTETRKDSKQTQANRSTRTQKKTRKQKWITWRWKNILFKKKIYTVKKRPARSRCPAVQEYSSWPSRKSVSPKRRTSEWTNTHSHFRWSTC